MKHEKQKQELIKEINNVCVNASLFELDLFVVIFSYNHRYSICTF